MEETPRPQGKPFDTKRLMLPRAGTANGLGEIPESLPNVPSACHWGVQPCIALMVVPRYNFLLQFIFKRWPEKEGWAARGRSLEDGRIVFRKHPRQ
jgi:hypothetical protein